MDEDQDLFAALGVSTTGKGKPAQGPVKDAPGTSKARVVLPGDLREHAQAFLETRGMNVRVTRIVAVQIMGSEEHRHERAYELPPGTRLLVYHEPRS